MAKKKKKRTVTGFCFFRKRVKAFKRANAVRVKKSKNGTVSFTPVQVVKRQRFERPAPGLTYPQALLYGSLAALGLYLLVSQSHSRTWSTTC
jgi:hypothetical protein